MSTVVKLNDFTRLWAECGDQVVEIIDRVGQSGWYILGDELRCFEDALASYWEIPHAVGVGNGLDAIEIALRAAGVSPGSRVLTTPLSAFATALAIIRAGCVPVFCDVNDTGLLDLAVCRATLRSNPTVSAIVPVHLYGHVVDLDGLVALSREFDVTIVEDCAQAIGATFRGRPVGTAGLAGAVSFYPTKNLGTFGDGGAVVTTSGEVARDAGFLRNYGQTATCKHELLGLNSRLDEIHAAVLFTSFLPRLTKWTARRRDIAERYREGIENRELTIPPVPEGSESVWHLFPVLVAPEDREGFRRHLRDQQIQTGVHYPVLIPEQPALLGICDIQTYGSLERARRFALGEVSLPIHPFLNDGEVDRVIRACSTWRPV